MERAFLEVALLRSAAVVMALGIFLVVGTVMDALGERTPLWKDTALQATNIIVSVVQSQCDSRLGLPTCGCRPGWGWGATGRFGDYAQ